MMKKSLKPFKKVTTEYFDDHQIDDCIPAIKRKIRVVTTTERITGSSKDPVISVDYESL
jgi:hypothetical protein